MNKKRKVHLLTVRFNETEYSIFVEYDKEIYPINTYSNNDYKINIDDEWIF
jgi:hypothetical protein